jgi:hypothetical protein
MFRRVGYGPFMLFSAARQALDMHKKDKIVFYLGEVLAR